MNSFKVNRILVINPNKSTTITESFKPLISKLNLPNVLITSFSYWTSALGPTIIQTQDDLNQSALLCIEPLLEVSSNYDGFLIACYADHPITAMMQTAVRSKPVVGIFGASISTALNLILPASKFGIITTGNCWISMLSAGVRRYVGTGKEIPETFGGVLASGINFSDISTTSKNIARVKVIQATRELVRVGDVSVICPGGAMLIGCENWIREACEMELGIDKGCAVFIVDQLVAGAMTLYSLLQLRF